MPNYDGPMMMLSGLQQSVLGNCEPHQGKPWSFVPSTGFGRAVLNTRMPNLGTVPYQRAPNTMSSVIKMKSLNGVLPAKSITHHVLRNPAPNPNNQQAPQGIARGQRLGLASNMDWEIHNISKDAPILPRASSVSRSGYSALGLTANIKI